MHRYHGSSSGTSLEAVDEFHLTLEANALAILSLENEHGERTIVGLGGDEDGPGPGTQQKEEVR